MIKSWKSKGLKVFFDSGDKSGIQARHEKRLKIILQRLDAATGPDDMNTPGMNFHKLIGNLKEHYAVSVNGNWRITFAFEGENVIDTNYIDYH